MGHESAHERGLAAEAENRPSCQSTIHPELLLVLIGIEVNLMCNEGGGWD